MSKLYIKLLLFIILVFGITGVCYAQATFNPPYCITEEDGDPFQCLPVPIRFANGNVTVSADGSVSIADQGGAVEGTAVLSTGESGGTKFLREDGDGTSSWQVPGGGGDFLADGTVAMTGNFNINTQAIEDANSNELATFVTAASAVNNIQVTNAATGEGVKLTAVGGDANIDLHLEPKGIGIIRLEEILPATAGQSLAEMMFDIDSSAQVSTSEFHAILVETTGTPAGEVAALGTVGKVDPIHQHVATVVTPSQTEFAGEKTGGGATWADGIDGSEIFVVNSDEIYFGSATQFDEVEAIMGTGATKNVIPTFWYNTAADTWTQFFPGDGTDGFQQSGDIIWLLSGITGLWTGDGDPGGADTTAGYWIKVIRTATPDPGTPTPTTIKIGLATTYSWDKTGAVDVLSMEADTVTEGGIAVYNDDEMDTFSELDAIVTDKALVNKADGAVWLGVHDFGGADTLEIPQDKTTAVEGQVTIDGTSGQFRYHGNSAQRTLTSRYTDCRTLETPVDADDNIPVWAWPEARTITDVHCWTEGGTSIAVTISDGTNALEAVTCDADGADDDGSIANGTFTANENVEWDFAAPTGTVDWVKVCVTTTVTAD